MTLVWISLYCIFQAKKLETKNISIDERNYKYLVIYFTVYVHNKSIKTLRLYYDELIGKIKENERKTFDGWWLYGRYSIGQD